MTSAGTGRNRYLELEPATQGSKQRLRILPRLGCWIVLLAMAMPAIAQETPSTPPPPATSSSSTTTTPSALPDNPKPELAAEASGKQTKRILFVVPNFKSVSMDEILPPQTPKQKFILMLQDSFDYSAFIYVGGLAGVADAEKSYPEFGHGAAAYGRDLLATVWVKV